MKVLLAHMRKGSFLLLLAFMAILSACGTAPVDSQTGSGDGGNVLAQNTPTPSQGEPTKEATKAPQTGNGDSSKFVYASVNVTIVSIEQQKEYNNHENYGQGFLLRINVKEENTSKNTAYMNYTDMRLLLPDGTIVESNRNGGASYIENGVVRNNWVDFPVASKQDVNALVWRVGAPTEYQMDIPLSKKGDLSKYQARVITPNSKVKYGIDWTVTKVTSALSYDGEQAKTGKRYIVVEVSGENNTGETFYAYPANNMRLKSSSVTEAPKKSTVPSYTETNFKGPLGVVAFEMPANETNFTLEFLAQEKVQKASTTFSV